MRCFVSDRRQFNCISDMVVNKVAGVLEIIEAARRRAGGGEAAEALGLAAENLEALTEWVRYLRVVQDLRSLRKDLEPGPGRRREDRYPLPPAMRDLVRLRVVPAEGAPVEARLLDFSRRGLRFLSPTAFRVGERCACTVSIPRTLPEEIAFEAEVRHCRPEGRASVIGASMREVRDEAAFRVFQKIYDFIVEPGGDGEDGGP